MSSTTKNLAIEGIVRDSIDVEKLGLTLVGREYATTLGRIDILTRDVDGSYVPIEIKIGCAGDSAVGQVLGYMQAVGASRGIIMANEFSKRVTAVASSLGIDLYPFRFDVIVSGESVVMSPDDFPDADEVIGNNPVVGFISDCCERGGFVEPGTFYHAYARWHVERYGTPPKEDQADITKSRSKYGFDKGGRKTLGNAQTWDDKPSITCYTKICLKNTPGNLSVYPDYVDAHWNEITGIVSAQCIHDR